MLLQDFLASRLILLLSLPYAVMMPMISCKHAITFYGITTGMFSPRCHIPPLIARFMGPSGADRTQVGPMLAPWTLLSGTTELWIGNNLEKISYYCTTYYGVTQTGPIIYIWLSKFKSIARKCYVCNIFPHFIHADLAQPMMTSSNGNIFGVTGPLCREFTGHRWVPCTKASDAELWCFLWSLIYAWINGWVNKGEAGDLRCNHAHYDVIVMKVKKGEMYTMNRVFFIYIK